MASLLYPLMIVNAMQAMITKQKGIIMITRVSVIFVKSDQWCRLIRLNSPFDVS